MTIRKVTIRGVEYTVEQAALTFGVRPDSIWRAYRNGSLDNVGNRALGLNHGKRIPVNLPDGRSFKSVNQAATELDIPASTLRLMMAQDRLGELCGVGYASRHSVDATSTFRGCRTTSTGPDAAAIHRRMAEYLAARA